jgi:hypothetical protein
MGEGRITYILVRNPEKEKMYVIYAQMKGKILKCILNHGV